MILLDGKTLAEQILSTLKPHGCLHIILIGDDPSSLKYVSLKEQKCREIDQPCVIHHLADSTTTTQVLALVDSLNRDASVTGFFIQLPLPQHIDKSAVLATISPSKDVDGLGPHSPFQPAVVQGIIRLLDHSQLLSAVKTAVIINDSDLIGQPLRRQLESRQIQVFITNKFTQNLSKISRGADLIVSATGVKGLVTREYVKPGAIVVDVANGDVDFANVAPLCSYITPTFGSIGPMTIACLLENLTMIK